MLNRLMRLYKTRILSACPAELIVISLELALAFIKYQDLPRSRQAICQLAEALDFRYELSQHLYSIYTVIEKKLTAGIVHNDLPAVSDAVDLINLLLKRWKETARSDTGPTVTRQIPKITIGLTYNAAGLCEYVDQDFTGGYKS